MKFNYVSGQLGKPSIRVFRSECGTIGKVVRTPAKGPAPPYTWGTPKTKYFVWDLPDNAPEYDTIEEAQAAVNKKGLADNPQTP